MFYLLSLIFNFIVFDIFLVLSFTVSVSTPACLALRTTTTSCPLKSFIVGCLNDSSEVASPLHTASKLPAPVTSKSNWSSASGIRVPCLSVSDTVTKAKSSPSASRLAASCCVHTSSFICAGLPAVRMVFSPTLLSLASYTTTFNSPGSYFTLFQRRR